MIAILPKHTSFLANVSGRATSGAAPGAMRARHTGPCLSVGQQSKTPRHRDPATLGQGRTSSCPGPAAAPCVSGVMPTTVPRLTACPTVYFATLLVVITMCPCPCSTAVVSRGSASSTSNRGGASSTSRPGEHLGYRCPLGGENLWLPLLSCHALSYCTSSSVCTACSARSGLAYRLSSIFFLFVCTGLHQLPPARAGRRSTPGGSLHQRTVQQSIAACAYVFSFSSRIHAPRMHHRSWSLLHESAVSSGTGPSSSSPTS
jgi:hypothetical protein